MPRRCKPVVSPPLHNVKVCGTSFLVALLFVGEAEPFFGVMQNADLILERAMVCFDLSWNQVPRDVRLSCLASSRSEERRVGKEC